MGFMTREEVMTGIWALLTPMIVATDSAPTTDQPFAFGSRRFQLWSDVPATNKPALFMTEPTEEADRADLSEPTKQTLDAFLWIYTDVGKDQAIYPVTVLNNLLDAVQTALNPGWQTGTQTLGGIITDVSIIGKILKDPGDLDGNGVAKIPLRIIVPVF